MVELDKLKIYCHSLKSELENGGTYFNNKSMNYKQIKVGDQSKVIEFTAVGLATMSIF